MNHVSVRMGALGALSAMLLGCASVTVTNDATVPSDARGTGTSRTPPVPTNIDGVVKQAQAQRKDGDFPAAARTLSQLVLLAPDDARVLGEYGKTLIAMGRADDALAFLERAVELKPNEWSLYSAQGVAYDQKGEYLAAQAAYGRALLLKPGDPTVLSNAALSHVQTGDLDGAEALLMQASRSSAEFPRIANNLALVRSLKNSRPPQASTIVAPKEMTPVPSPTPIETPSAPDSSMASLATPEPQPSEIPMAAHTAIAAETQPVGADEAGAAASAWEQPEMNPSVQVQPLPSRPPESAAKPKPKPVGSALSAGAPKSEPALQLRPTPADVKPSNRPKTADAKRTASAAVSDPLGLRPTVADPPATLEASARR